MKIYIGYVGGYNPIPIWMSLDKTALKKQIKEYEEELGSNARKTWIEEYDLHKAEVIEFEN